MTENYQTLVRNHIFNHIFNEENTFISATFKRRSKGQSAQTAPIPWQQVSVRPVELKSGYYFQFSYFDGQKDITKNYRPDEARARVDEILAFPLSSLQVKTTREELRVQITKKGKAILHRDKPATPLPEPNLVHDRQKQLLLSEDDPPDFLQGLGITTNQGQLKSDRRSKFQQINEFLKLIDQTPGIDDLISAHPLTLIDCGCGNAYLSFAVYYYLTVLKNQPVSMLGLDLKQNLIKRRSKLAQDLGWSGLAFKHSAIIDYKPDHPPDLVLALHACDTATDEALAQAINWEAQFIFSVPCCHHHLQAQLASVEDLDNLPQRPLLRHGILKERLGDILTDSFRALILRIMGYRTDVIEFVSSEHTAKNLMIRAVHRTSPGDSQFVQEYLALKQEWQVTPYLETLLGSALTKFFDS